MIGIFDSGSGGLSVLREILKILPEEKYFYYADNAYCPYGEKTPEFIQSRGREITDFLLGKGADIIVVACNTATAAAIATLRKEYPVKFIGMEPAVKPAALSSESGVIGVLATAGTLKGLGNADIIEFTASDATRDMLYADRIHLTEEGNYSLAELISQTVAAFD